MFTQQPNKHALSLPGLAGDTGNCHNITGVLERCTPTFHTHKQNMTITLCGEIHCVTFAMDIFLSILIAAFAAVFGKLMRVLCDKGLDLIVTSHMGVAITAIKLCAQIYGLRNVPIEERYAIVIVALWEDRNIFTDLVHTHNLLHRINKKFRKVNRNLLTPPELNAILSDLDDLRCIRFNPNGTIQLIEEIKRSYNVSTLSYLS